MPAQTTIIKVWCRGEQLHRTANLLAWTLGQRVEIPVEADTQTHSYVLVHTRLAQYTDEAQVCNAMGLDIIGKVAGVLAWEVLPEDRESDAASRSETEAALVKILEALPVPISVILRADGTYSWKWASASGQAKSCLEAAEAALVQVMQTYRLLRSELLG